MDMVKFILQQNVRFTDEEKEACLPAVDKVGKFAELARNQGLLAFVPALEKESNILFKRAMAMAVDGIDRYTLTESLQLMILSNSYSGEELLRSLIYTVGISRILCGDEPELVRMKLAAMLGKKYLDRIIYSYESREEKEKEIREFRDNISEFMPTDKDNDFEDLFQRMSNPCIQRVIREMSEYELARALKGVRIQKVWEAVFENLSSSRQLHLISWLKRFEDISPNDIQKAQKKIAEFINKLEDEGEIIISKYRNKL